MTAPISPVQPGSLLVCTDGSAASQGAVEAALVLARRWSSRLLLLQVLEYNPGFASLAIDSIKEWEEEARKGLHILGNRARALGLEADIMIRQGEAAHRVILAETEKHRPDLIIMGRRGRSDLASVLMGSVTARVVAASSVKVLIVPRKAPLTFQRLLVAHDGSPCSNGAWREALAMSRDRFCYLLAVAVARKAGAIPQFQELMGKLQGEADRQGIPLDALVLQGIPEAAILQAAEARGADLLILGSRGRSGLSRFLLGSVAEQVIGKANCPVLVVRGPENKV
jgi:nucleotide-binding universal stress UspA family protein